MGLNQGYIMSYPSSRILAIKMARYSEDLHRCGCSYGFTVFYKVGLLRCEAAGRAVLVCSASALVLGAGLLSVGTLHSDAEAGCNPHGARPLLAYLPPGSG